ncbi:hypothetical protein TNCV_3190121 [Trichonephila clavipes]|nr:hypothetical protein TNCV_3190121 [Trichonephila clavipes]
MPIKSYAIRFPMPTVFHNVWKKEAESLQQALDLLQSLPSESSDALTDDFSDEEVPVNHLLQFSLEF